MKILSLETSCDETGAAVVTVGNPSQTIQVLSNIIATSLDIHATTGGIIPETAAREQVKYIIPVIITALTEAFPPKNGKKDFLAAKKILQNEIDAIAVTYGPGLIGSLLVGIETAKTLAYIFNKPIIPVNHLLAHLYANFIDKNEHAIRFPFIGLIVSGGHTDLLYFKNHREYEWLGGTRDDAAGEAFDKIGRLLELQYPAGPEIERRAGLVEKRLIKFQSPMLYSPDFDFSFSGLKTEVMRFVKKETALNDELKNQICAATQDAIIKVLVAKTIKASEKYNCSTILLGGGVSANQALLNELRSTNYKLQTTIFVPERKYCTDNGAMIGAYAALNNTAQEWKNIHAEPELYFG